MLRLTLLLQTVVLVCAAAPPPPPLTIPINFVFSNQQTNLDSRDTVVGINLAIQEINANPTYNRLLTLVPNVVDSAVTPITLSSFQIANYKNPLDAMPYFKLFVVEESASSLNQIAQVVPADLADCPADDFSNCYPIFLSRFGLDAAAANLSYTYIPTNLFTPPQTLLTVHIDDSYAMQAEPMLHFAINYNASIVSIYSNDAYGQSIAANLQNLASLRSVNVVQYAVPVSFQNDVASFTSLLQSIIKTTQSSSNNSTNAKNPVFFFIFLDGFWATSFASAAVQSSLLSPASSTSLFPLVLSEQLYAEYLFEQTNVLFNLTDNKPVFAVNAAAMQGVVGVESLSSLAKDVSLLAKLRALYPNEGARHEVGATERVYYDSVRQIANAALQMLSSGANPEEVTPFSIVTTMLSLPPMFGASGPWQWGDGGNQAQRTVTDYAFSQLNATNIVYFRQQFAQWTRQSGITFSTNDPLNALYLTGGASSFPPPVPLPTLYYPTFWEWSSVPFVGSPPSARFGACQQLSGDGENLIVFFGANSKATGALSEAHVFSFATRIWTPAPILGSVHPRANYNGMCTQNQNMLYSFGGVGHDGVVGELWKYDFLTKRWTQLQTATNGGPADVVIDRTNSAAVQLNNKWYIWAGYHSNMQSEVFLVLDFAAVSLGFEVISPDYNDTSTVFQAQYSANGLVYKKRDIKALLNQTFDAVAVAIPGSTFNISIDFIAIIGSSYYNETYALPSSPHNIMFLYNVNEGLWTPVYTALVADCPSGNIYNPINTPLTGTVSGILVGTLIYVYYPRCVAAPIWSLDVTDRCMSTTCKWDYVTNMNHQPNIYSTPLLVGSKFLVGFGLGATSSSNYLEVLSPAYVAATGLIVAPKPIVVHGNIVIPPARAYHTSAIIGNLFIIFGGYGTLGEPKNDLWALNLDAGTWAPLSPQNTPPPARFGHGGRPYAFTYFIYFGTDGTNFFNDIWSYSFVTNLWLQRVPVTAATPSARAFFVNLFVGTDIITYGGQSLNNQVFADVWRYSVINDEWTLVLDATPTTGAGALKMMKYPDPVLGPYNVTYDPNDVNVPPPLTRANGDIVTLANGSSYFFICGGWDASFNDVKGSWWLLLDNYNAARVTNPLLLQFQFLGDMDNARHGHDVVAKNDAVYVVGGVSTPSAAYGAAIFSISTQQWAHLRTTNPTTELSVTRDGTSIESYGNRLWVFGGAKVDVSNIIAPTFVTADTSQMVLGPALANNQVAPVPAPVLTLSGDHLVFMDPSVSGSSCGSGAVRTLKQCASCPAGTYKPANITVCLACPVGKYGVVAGANLDGFCVLCGVGTFNPNNGSSSCSACPVGTYCPVGSVLISAVAPPVTLSLTDSSQAVGIPDNSDLVATTGLTAFYVLLGIMGAFTLVYVVAHVVPYTKTNEKDGSVVETMQVERFIEYDWWYSGDHDTEDDKPIFTRQTPLGGCCTLLSIPVAIYFLFTLSYGYALNNYTETRALIPFVTLDPPNPTVNVQVTVSASNYPGQCISQPGVCVPLISVTAPAFSGNSIVLECNLATAPVAPLTATAPVYPPSASPVCTVVWHCYNCTVNVATSAVSVIDFLFQETNTYANALTWRIDANSGFPDFDPYNSAKSNPFNDAQQNSSLWGAMIAPSAVLFRGQSPPTSVSTRVTPTHHAVKYVKSSFTGWTSNFVSQSAGSQLSPANFATADGLHVQFNVTNEITAFDIVVTRNQEPEVFASNILGAVSGAFGLMTLFMLWLETYVEDNVWPRVSPKQAALTAGARMEKMLSKFEDEVREIVQKPSTSTRTDTEMNNFTSSPL